MKEYQHRAQQLHADGMQLKVQSCGIYVHLQSEFIGSKSTSLNWDLSNMLADDRPRSQSIMRTFLAKLSQYVNEAIPSTMTDIYIWRILLTQIKAREKQQGCGVLWTTHVTYYAARPPFLPQRVICLGWYIAWCSLKRGTEGEYNQLFLANAGFTLSFSAHTAVKTCDSRLWRYAKGRSVQLIHLWFCASAPSLLPLISRS